MKKDRQFSIRISSQDLETIHQKAAQAHMSQSDYVTACCLGKRIVILDGLKEVLRQQKAIDVHRTYIAQRVQPGRPLAPPAGGAIPKPAAAKTK